MNYSFLEPIADPAHLRAVSVVPQWDDGVPTGSFWSPARIKLPKRLYNGLDVVSQQNLVEGPMGIVETQPKFASTLFQSFENRRSKTRQKQYDELDQRRLRLPNYRAPWTDVVLGHYVELDVVKTHLSLASRVCWELEAMGGPKHQRFLLPGAHRHPLSEWPYSQEWKSAYAMFYSFTGAWSHSNIVGNNGLIPKRWPNKLMNASLRIYIASTLQSISHVMVRDFHCIAVRTDSFSIPYHYRSAGLQFIRQLGLDAKVKRTFWLREELDVLHEVGRYPRSTLVLDSEESEWWLSRQSDLEPPITSVPKKEENN